MKKILLAIAFSAMFTTGCVGMGLTISPADGSMSLQFKAQDCISDNMLGRTIKALPSVGDWAMLNWGCSESPMIASP